MDFDLFWYFIFVQATLLLPGYAYVKKSRLLNDSPGIQLCLAYVFALVVFGFFATINYAFNVDPSITRTLCWAIMIFGLLLFIRERYYRPLLAMRFPLFCLLAMSLFSLIFISLSFNAPYKLIPDPTPRAERNYTVFDVKVLNVAQTRANDNYIPYRQAQFFVNRSDPARDSLVAEWGVSFFQRTPLMGAVVANYFTLLDEKPPVAYVWSDYGHDPDRTFIKFQIIAQILNSLLVIPGFFALQALFNRRVAIASALFLVTSQFFVYNAFFSWPKSLVGFFVLTSFLLLLRRGALSATLAGFVSGIAYLTHDLAVLYIGAAFLYLLIMKRFRDIVLYVLPCIIMAAPWLLTSSLKYHKPSSFIYYPFSVKGIPQTEDGSVIFREFFNTSIWTHVSTKLQSIFYLFSPYQAIFSNGQELGRRIWTLGLYSIPGAMGIGLIIPAYIALFRMFKRIWPATIFIVVPAILCVFIIGWPLYSIDGLGALHFAEAIVIVWTGLALKWLLGIGNTLLTMTAYLLNVLQFIFFLLYSYLFRQAAWLNEAKDLFLLTVLLGIIALCGWLLYLVCANKKNWLTA